MNAIKRIKRSLALVVGLMVGVQQTAAQPTKKPAADSLEKLQRLIAPGPDDSQWMQVPWMPSSNIYAARKKAAEEGKPLLLWYMAGEPLGTC
ncbi:MAG: hypothetical protein HY289_13210 [Planctomycetes bacterium]|nr:hypothetical protein [Planctomycetota bacterium]